MLEGLKRAALGGCAAVVLVGCSGADEETAGASTGSTSSETSAQPSAGTSPTSGAAPSTAPTTAPSSTSRAPSRTFTVPTSGGAVVARFAAGGTKCWFSAVHAQTVQCETADMPPPSVTDVSSDCEGEQARGVFLWGERYKFYCASPGEGLGGDPNAWAKKASLPTKDGFPVVPSNSRITFGNITCDVDGSDAVTCSTGEGASFSTGQGPAKVSGKPATGQEV